MKNYKELIIWQKGVEIVRKVYVLTKKFPAEEKYGIVSQNNKEQRFQYLQLLQKEAVESDKDYARFLQIY